MGAKTRTLTKNSSIADLQRRYQAGVGSKDHRGGIRKTCSTTRI